jgi:hypothetical protein
MNSFKQLVIVGILIHTFHVSSAQISYTDKDCIITGLSGGGKFQNLAVSPIDQNLMMVTSDMSGAYVSVSGLENFKMIHHSQLLNVTNSRACFHPKDKDSIFASSLTGLKVSSDRGINWKPIGNIGRIEYGLAIHPVNTKLMLAGSASKVYRSLNAGVNWTQVTGPAGEILGFHFDKTSADYNGTCFAATSSGVWRSDDGGSTWAKKANGLPAVSVLTFAGASNKTLNKVILYCGAGTSLYRSTDRGETWALLPSITGTIDFLLSGDADPMVVYTFIGYSIKKSLNAGDSWSGNLYVPKVSDTGFNLVHNYFTSYMGQNAYGSVFTAAIASNNSNFVCFTSSMSLMYTDNGGKTWKSAHSKPGETVPKSFQSTGLNNTTTWHYYVDPFDENRQYICYTDIGFARSVDKGKSWLYWPYWGPDKTLKFDWVFNLFEIAFDPEIPGKMWGAFSRVHDIPNANAITGTHVTQIPEDQRYGGIGFSSDYAAKWVDDGYNTGLPDRAAVSVILDPKSPKNNRTLYAAIYEKGVYRSTDDGHSWTLKSSGLGSATNMHLVRLQLHHDTLFCLITAVSNFSADGVGLYRSVDGAESWQKVNAAKDILWPRDFAVNPNNTKEIYIGARQAGSQNGSLWKTTNGGSGWTAISSKGYHFGAYYHPSHQGWIYMTLCETTSSVAGLWLSKDNGITWLPYDKIPHRWIQRVDFDHRDPDILYVSTFGSSAMKVPADPNDQLMSSVSYIKKEGIRLFPNPCKDDLTIQISGKPEIVDYKIFDVQGKLIGTGKINSGNEKIVVPFQSGLYLLSINKGGQVYNQKFIKQ